tara:strand:+ start:428 stop:1120 length:693 start_codon:yes stop_codon:yes gene_type:complete
MGTKPKKKLKNKNKKKRRTGLTSAEQNSLDDEVRQLMGRGKSDVKILEQLGLTATPQVLSSIKKRIHITDTETFSQLNNVKVYTEFVEKSKQNINDLEEMQQRFKWKHQYTAIVAAIKMKHEINKDVIKTGQEMGFIEKKGNEVSIEAEMSFSTMSTDDVKQEVADEVARLNELANGNIIEMRPELLATLENDEARIRKFIPSGSILEEEPKAKKTKTKMKMKVKLKKRL